MIEPDSEYRTTETPLAAYLIQEGFNLLIIEYEPPSKGKRRATFVFENNTIKLREHVSVYNRGEAMINLALYEHAKSSLIDRIMRFLP